MPSPKDNLLGLTIGKGWKVTEIRRKGDGETGGNFSTGYIVERDGTKAFLKAMDLTKALLAHPDNQLDSIRFVIDMIQFEGNILEECNAHGLSRIVRLIEIAVIDLDASATDPISRAVSRVHGLIFELGGKDVRKGFGAPNPEDTSMRLKVLHNITAAIQQLHSIGIAHQDVKPSNILDFNGVQHKVADLGRATSLGRTGPLDNEVFPGDPTYCPPEFAYGHTPTDHNDRRFATDAYMLGSMISFLFTLQSTTTLLQQALPDHLLPPRWQRSSTIAPWTGNFDEVLPYLVQAMTRVRSYVESHIPVYCRSELGEAFSQLVNPSPYERGHPKSRAQIGRQIGLEKYISLFDKLSKRAALEIATPSKVLP
jgi:eukaryotic-like serine/threonine-protein kinase